MDFFLVFRSSAAGTPYAGGAFRVKLILGKEFPQTPPKAFFLTKIFHPNVASNGEICVNTLKKDWTPDLGLKHILLVSEYCPSTPLQNLTFSLSVQSPQTIKCLLIVPNAESALNEEAGKMLLERYDDYSQRARMMTEIHAQPTTSKSMASHQQSHIDADSGADDGPQSKKHASETRVLDKKKEKLIKEKKRILKRL